PVLTQMALNIATLAAALKGTQPSAAETSAIQNISNTAQTDLTTLQTLYNQYKANPDVTTLQKIQAVIADMQQQLPAQLQLAHISDPALSARISAAVGLILSTVESFASLIPTTGVAPRALRTVQVPKAKELKARWNAEVCASAAGCVLK